MYFFFFLLQYLHFYLSMCRFQQYFQLLYVVTFFFAIFTVLHVYLFLAIFTFLHICIFFSSSTLIFLRYLQFRTFGEKYDNVDYFKFRLSGTSLLPNLGTIWWKNICLFSCFYNIYIFTCPIFCNIYILTLIPFSCNFSFTCSLLRFLLFLQYFHFHMQHLLLQVFIYFCNIYIITYLPVFLQFYLLPCSLLHSYLS